MQTIVDALTNLVRAIYDTITKPSLVEMPEPPGNGLFDV
jgi:hypothetical protein